MTEVSWQATLIPIRYQTLDSKMESRYKGTFTLKSNLRFCEGGWNARENQLDRCHCNGSGNERFRTLCFGRPYRIFGPFDSVEYNMD
jgi:hypothetical protein